MLKRGLRIILVIWFPVLCCFTLASAQQPKPRQNTYVHDFANVIRAESESQLQEKARRLKEQLHTEVALVTIESLHGEDQFDYSLKMAREWGIGSPDYTVRGILILVSVQDHKTSFRTSRHLEGELPDGVTGEISREMNAFFKREDFGGGFSRGLDLIINRLEQTNDPQSSQALPSTSRVSWAYAAAGVGGVGLLGFIFYLVRKRKGRKQSEERQRVAAAREAREKYFKQERLQEIRAARERKKASKRLAKAQPKKSPPKRPSPQHPSWQPSPPQEDRQSPYSSSSSSGYDYSSDYSSSSSSDSSSSSSHDSSYSGGSDYGGGGSDSSW